MSITTWLLLLPSTLACWAHGTANPPGDLPAAASQVATVPESLLGTWASTACAERAFKRELTFFSNGHFAGRDYVAPCPPNTLCVWSGIIEWKGTFTVAGDQILLLKDPNTPGRQAEGQPTNLWLGPDGAPQEQPADCAYLRQPG